MHRINQYTSTRHSSPIAIALLALSLGVAGPAVAAGEHGGGHDDGHGGGGGHSFGFGSPAAESEADRTVTVTARDDMTFSPDSISIDKGTTIRFIVDNVGQLQHSFTLATPTQQSRHEEEMQGMSMDRMAGHMDDDPNGIVVQPGETGSITWRFTEATTVQFACHIPGHYPAGMKGSIRVKRRCSNYRLMACLPMAEAMISLGFRPLAFQLMSRIHAK